MVALPLFNPSEAGTAETLTAVAAGGDSFPFPSNGIVLRVKNAHATDNRTITLVGQVPCNQGVTHSKALTFPPGTYSVVIPPRDQYRDTNGKIQLTYSDAGADLSVAAISR